MARTERREGMREGRGNLDRRAREREEEQRYFFGEQLMKDVVPAFGEWQYLCGESQGKFRSHEFTQDRGERLAVILGDAAEMGLWVRLDLKPEVLGMEGVNERVVRQAACLVSSQMVVLVTGVEERYNPKNKLGIAVGCRSGSLVLLAKGDKVVARFSPTGVRDLKLIRENEVKFRRRR